jgi:hypothetical protein
MITVIVGWDHRLVGHRRLEDGHPRRLTST